jgi:hypothetical protein
VRRLVEHRLPELVVAAVDSDVSHAAPAPGRFPGRLADARRPADLRLARPQMMTERAALRPVFEQRNGHLNDHTRTSRYASMITVGRIRIRSRRRRPRRGCPRRMCRPRWRRREQAPHGSGRLRPKHPQWPSRLPGRAAGAPRRQVPQPGGNALVRSLMLHLSRPGSGSDTRTLPVTSPTVPCPPLRRGQEPGRRTGARARCGQGRERGLGKAPAARQGPVQPDDRQGPYCPVRISRTLLVLTSCRPAACQKPQSTRSIEGLVRSAGQDPRR